jgi:hypothetical protein
MALAMIAIMLVATSMVLLGQDPLPDVVWSAPLAAAIAIALTVYRLRTTPAEILVYADAAAVRTVWEVATRSPAVPTRVLPPRRVQEGINVGIGGDVLTLTDPEWPRLDELHRELAAAAERARPDAG